MTDHDGHTEREWLEGLRYEDKFPDAAPMPSTEGLRPLIAAMFERAIEQGNPGDDYAGELLDAIAPHVERLTADWHAKGYAACYRLYKPVIDALPDARAERDRLQMELEEANDLAAEDARQRVEALNQMAEMARLANETSAQLTQAREALTEILAQHHWVDSHPGRPAKRMLNSVALATYDRWRAALAAITQEPTPEPSTDCEDICMERCQGPCGVLPVEEPTP